MRRALKSGLDASAEQKIAVMRAQLDRIAKAFAALSEIMKRSHETSASIIQNLKA